MLGSLLKAVVKTAILPVAIKEQLVSSTSTWRTPTKEEDIMEIIYLAKKIQKMKWYESKRHFLRCINACAYRLNNIHKQ